MVSRNRRSHPSLVGSLNGYRRESHQSNCKVRNCAVSVLLLFFRPLANEVAFRDHEIQHEIHCTLLGIEPTFTPDFITLPNLRLKEPTRHYLHKAGRIPQECCDAVNIRRSEERRVGKE